MASIVKAQQSGVSPMWEDLRLPDTIRAHSGCEDVHLYRSQGMPPFLKSMFRRREDPDAVLISGEVAFQALAVSQIPVWNELFSIRQDLEKAKEELAQLREERREMKKEFKYMRAQVAELESNALALNLVAWPTKEGDFSRSYLKTARRSASNSSSSPKSRS